MKRRTLIKGMAATVPSLWLSRASGNDFLKDLDYCTTQAGKTASSLTNTTAVPRSIANGKKEWRLVDRHDWTSGFWPGIEWYLYEYTKRETWKKRAEQSQRMLRPLLIHQQLIMILVL